MLGKIEGKRRRGWQRMRQLDGMTDSMDMSLSNLQEMVKPGVLQSMGSQRVGHDWVTELNWRSIRWDVGSNHLSGWWWEVLMADGTHSSWHKVASQVLKVSLVVNWKAATVEGTVNLGMNEWMNECSLIGSASNSISVSGTSPNLHHQFPLRTFTWKVSTPSECHFVYGQVPVSWWFLQWGRKFHGWQCQRVVY